MPVEKTDNNDSIYNDIDEVLAAPPSKLVAIPVSTID